MSMQLWWKMSKRSRKFKRKSRDFYATPAKAVEPLLPFLNDKTRFAEPCCGDGALVKHLEAAGHICVSLDDIVHGGDALDFEADQDCDGIITNPPWSRDILHKMIEHFRKQRPTWLLLDADWMHTKQAIPYMAYCHKIVSVGRVSWEQNGVSGFDNCCWYLFMNMKAVPEFYGRAGDSQCGAGDSQYANLYEGIARNENYRNTDSWD